MGTNPSEKCVAVGFGQAIITPDFPVELTGYGNNSTRISTSVLSDLCVHILAFQDADGNRALVITADLMLISSAWTEELAQWCEENVGVPADNLIFSAVHQHSTPYLQEEKMDAMGRPRIHAAIKAAIADLSPAEMYIARVETQAMNFVRHYWNAEGEIVTPNHNKPTGGLVGHESEADNVIQLLKFKRSGKKDILVVNFQTHPYMGTGGFKTEITSDWVGVLRDQVSQQLNCDVCYFSGAGGNVADGSMIKAERVSVDYLDHGRRAAEYILSAEGTYEKVSGGSVKAKRMVVTYEADHSMDHLVDIARPIRDEFLEGDFLKAKEMAEETPEIFSIYHARSIISKSEAPRTKDMPIMAVSIGDVAFTGHPYEMFDTNGMELKNGTVGNENYFPEEQMENPYKMTIVATIANGYNSYIPSRMGYTNGGYSTDTALFAPGSGERIVADYLKILNELHS